MTLTQTQKIQVVAAVIEQQSKFLICQRPLDKRYGGLWEFPGGKVEDGETFLDATRRELTEELGVAVSRVGETFLSVKDPGSRFVINFLQTVIEGQPSAIEHNAIAWVSTDQLLSYDLAINDRIFGEHILALRGDNGATNHR